MLTLMDVFAFWLFEGAVAGLGGEAGAWAGKHDDENIFHDGSP